MILELILQTTPISPNESFSTEIILIVITFLLSFFSAFIILKFQESAIYKRMAEQRERDRKAESKNRKTELEDINNREKEEWNRWERSFTNAQRIDYDKRRSDEALLKKELKSQAEEHEKNRKKQYEIFLESQEKVALRENEKRKHDWKILMHQIKAENELAQEHELKELSDYWDYLKVSLRNIIQPGQNQANHFDEFSKRLEVEQVADFGLSVVSALSVSWFFSIDGPRLQRSFFTIFEGTNEDKVQKYFELHTAMEYIKTVKDQFPDQFNNFKKKGNEFEEGFMESFEPLWDQFLEIDERISSSEELSSFEKDTHKSIREWFKIKDRHERNDMYSKLNLWVKKLEPVSIKYNNRIQMKAISNCAYFFDSYVGNRKIYGEIFRNHAERLNEQVEKIQRICKTMSNLEPESEVNQDSDVTKKRS